MEPEYIAEGDEFNDNSWRYPNTFFERTVLEITGRKYFKSEAQAKRVRAIAAHSLGDSPKYPIDYLKQMIAWCQKKNYHRTVIVLDALISAIRNPDNLAKFYKGEPVVEDRSGYADDDISW
jgi:hypothetical protein